MRQMCLKVGKIVSSKPGNWVRCRPAKLVISSHFRASHLIIHTEKLFSYHEMSSGQETVERVTSASILRCVGNYKEMAWRPNTNTSSISSVQDVLLIHYRVSSVQFCVRRKLENNDGLSVAWFMLEEIQASVAYHNCLAATTNSLYLSRAIINMLTC